MDLEDKTIYARALLEKTLINARKDPAYFISQCCYTFDPKRAPYHFEFKLFDYQIDYVHDLQKAIEVGYDVFIDKCREMGATYCTLDLFLWFWLFIPGSNFLVGSRKESEVDNTKEASEGTNKESSLFGKFEYTLSKMHPYFLPKDFILSKHLTYMSLINPENGNVIEGESSNGDFSRGGRRKAILLDEFAFWDNDAAAWGSTADTTDCRIALTTPGMKPSKAKRLRFGEDEEEIKVISLPYHLDPRKLMNTYGPEKDQYWLDYQRKRRSKEDFAREIMIDWEGSLTGIVYPEIAYAERGEYPYDPRWPLYCSWDFGLDGVSIIWLQKNLNTGRIRLVDYYENHDKTIDFYYPFLGKDINPQNADSYSVDDIKAIRELRPLKDPVHFGDPDVSKRSLLIASSTKHELEKVGIYVMTNRMSNDFASRREQTKIVLQEGIEINVNARTQKFLLCMENARYPQRPDNSQATTAINLPIHDWTSHGRTALEYFCVNYRLGTGSAPSGGVLKPHERSPYKVAFPQDAEGNVKPPDILELTMKSFPSKGQ